MKIFVINTGSSSIKYQLFDMDRPGRLAAGLAERIGEGGGVITHRTAGEDGAWNESVEQAGIADHAQGLHRIVALLTDGRRGVIRDKEEISAVGHRVVHGGEHFKSTVLIDDDVTAAIRENIPLAPLHNPPNLLGVEVARKVFPRAAQVAVFDTAFHQTLPPRAYLYAIPRWLHTKHRIRKYGFHGTSHAYVAQAAADFLGRPLDAMDLITIHLGNGASMAAIHQGQCVDTTMGMTPMAGLVMGARCGDIDPAIPFFLMKRLGMAMDEVERLLNSESGLKGLCGANDMREVLEMRAAGAQTASEAVDVYVYRIKKTIGAYFAVLGRLDAVVFTAGIGENAPLIRELACSGLEGLGVALDPEKNQRPDRGVRDVSRAESSVKVLVAPTDEEWRIAQETLRAVRDVESQPV